MKDEDIQENEFERKKKLCEKLGALKFQKVVFKVEELKFKIIDKVCPNICEKFNKWCDKKVNKLCSKNISEEDKSKIIFEYNCRKMAFKRELVEKKNVNYHFNSNNATKFYKYLEWNKNVHVKGLIGDTVTIIVSILGILLFPNILFTLSLIYGIISSGVNFQCINLQNYNICRFEEKKHILARLEKRRKEQDFKNYYDVSKSIYEELSSSVELPKSDVIVSKLTTSEQINQLRNLALEIKRQRENLVPNEEDNKIRRI